MKDLDKIAAALRGIAESIDGLSHAVHRLGNAEAGSPQGGLEALGTAVMEASDRIAASISAPSDERR